MSEHPEQDRVDRLTSKAVRIRDVAVRMKESLIKHGDARDDIMQELHTVISEFMRDANEGKP